MHPHFEAFLQSRIEEASAAARRVGSIGHSGLVGQLREILVQDLLRPLLPHYSGFGTGKIVDHRGGESRQIDVVVYDKRMTPPLVYDVEGTIGLFPVEACMYAIEVKSRVDAEAVRHATRVGRSVGDLSYAPEWLRGDDDLPVARVSTVLFGFETTVSTPEGERTRWISHQDGDWYPVVRQQGNSWQRYETPPLSMICVRGRGYGFFQPVDQSYLWRDGDSAGTETITWLNGVSNTVLGRTAAPAIPFGHYFLDGSSLDSYPL